jgi:pimeloyl-ACP methyl ester carboxylesterase
MSKKFVSPANYISPINVNGLDGRVLYLKAANKNNKKEILVIYDERSNLERWWGLDSALKHYGNVTAVDLPGLGGMESFYKIGLKASIDNYADYLASFVKLRYKRKRFTIFAIGFGFVAATRMLQRNPTIIPKVHLVVSLNGLAHHDDLKNSRNNSPMLLAEQLFFSLPLTPSITNLAASSPLVLAYKRNKISGNKKLDQFNLNFRLGIEKEIDVRSSRSILRELSSLDNCDKRIDLPLWNIGFGEDKKKLNHSMAEQHLRVTFTKYRYLASKMSKVPFIISDEKTGQKVLPAVLRRELKKPVR